MDKVKFPRPKWVIEEVERLRKKFKGKGTVQVKYVHGTWQVKLARSVWDKEKKRPVKKEKHLGVLKEGVGFIPKHRKYEKRKKVKDMKRKGDKGKNQSVAVDLDLYVKIEHPGWDNRFSYLWGADRVGLEALKGVWTVVDRLFDYHEAGVIKALSLTWGVWGILPLKSVYRQWNRMWSHEEMDVSLSPQRISEVLEHVGRRPAARSHIGAWFLSLHSDKPMLFDMTHLFTWSEGIDSACLGWNAEKKWLPQVRTGIVSAGDRPVMLEVAGGNLHEIHMIRLLEDRLLDHGIKKKLILVADRACASRQLVEEFSYRGQPFVLPLRKNMVSKAEYMKVPDRYFKFCKRRIGWREIEDKIGGRSVRLLLFHDPVLGGHQTNAYRARYMDEGKDRQWLEDKEASAGWIALWTNTDLKPQEVFETYKMRQHVEEIVDRFRNHLLAEGSYMRDDDKLQGWLWVAMLALQVHWFILDSLKQAKLLSKWSVEEVLRELREIRKEPTPSGWRITPVPQSTRNMLKRLGFDKYIWD